jgi:transposase
MARPTTIDDTTKRYAQKICTIPSSIGQMKKALCVTLSTMFCADTETIANLLGIDRSTVFRYRDELKKEANGFPEPIIHWGGRRNSLMTEDDEAAFLEQWREAALSGEIVNLKDLHIAHAEAVGKSIPISSTYRMLERNGWRKISPDTMHPKSKPAVQEEFKKKSLKRWLPPLIKT